MIKIGFNGDSFSLVDGSGYIQIASKSSHIIFEGPCRIALNSKIRVVNGTLRFGALSRIGSDSRIICNGGNISIGTCTGITFGCTVMNSSFHYTYDLENSCYRNRTKDIRIGNYNWIGNQTTILGGTVTPDYAIVGSGSLLNRSYANLENQYPLIAGRPAKLVRTGIKRVFSPNTEVKISRLFKTNNADAIHHEEIIDSQDDILIEM
ncbi:MAG: hypothetical protein HDR82_11265 [Bacteroides sp.]|nr:hypothetical protein [Bacteroides sp.]